MGSSVKKVAFIGLGKVGSNIANRLLAGGIDLTIWNRTASKMTPLIERGAKPAAGAKEAAQGADVVLTSLMDDQSALDILGGDQHRCSGQSELPVIMVTRRPLVVMIVGSDRPTE